MIGHLTLRGLVAIDGDEAAPFLNDLITANTLDLPEGAVRQSLLLTPQGRVLFDMLISRDGDGFLIELDLERRDAFIKKMSMYRLRRAVNIAADAREVYALTDHTEGFQDSRFDQGVMRFYGNRDDADAADADWQAFRYQHGVAEGAIDLPPEKALPLEARLDLNDGISFEKGCYIGQEVTARTRYRGLLKRVYFPIRSADLIAAPCDIEQSGKNAGHILSMVAAGESDGDEGFIGLASVRLEALQDDAPITADGHVITVEQPARLLPIPSK